MRSWESVPAPPKAGAAGRGGRISLRRTGEDRVARGGFGAEGSRAVAVFEPALLRPGLAGDAVAVVVVLRIVARLAAVGWGKAHHARRRAVRRCRDMPQRHRQRRPRKVLDGRVEESGQGKCSECRHAHPMPMPAQPAARALPSAERGHPLTLPRHAVRIAALGLRKV
jgi:hypothetical protein